MSKRWPPILGITGFDGGAKPAISLATLKRLRKPDVAQEAPAAECPDVDTITLALSGVLVDCGCVDIPENSASVIVTDVSFNGTFTLTGGSGFWTGTGGTVHYINYNDSGCEGDPTFESDAETSIQVTCDNGNFEIICWAGAVAFYVSSSWPTLTGRPNEIGCGDPVPPIIGGVFRGVAHDGTATITV